MPYIFDEGDMVVVQLPYPQLTNGELKEEVVEIVADKRGRCIKGPFPTVQEAFYRSLQALSEALEKAELILDRIEYLLETEEKVKPAELYTASYTVHSLYNTAVGLRNIGAELRKKGLVSERNYAYSKSLARKAQMLRLYARDLRLLHTNLIQLSPNLSMKKLTLLGTVALPALIITSFYGTNLKWLPLADNPPLVMLILIITTAMFGIAINKL